MSQHQDKLGNKLGNIEQNYMLNKHNISSSGQIEVEISPKTSFDKSFQFTEGEYKRFEPGWVERCLGKAKVPGSMPGRGSIITL